MGRVLAGLLVVLACCAVTTTTFAKKGFYIGGGFVSQGGTGDLDGKAQVTTSAGDRLGSFGKLDAGAGNDFDIGYGFNKYFALEGLQTLSLNTAKHKAEKSETDAAISNVMLGVRLTAPVADSLDLFLRLGTAGSAVAYAKYGHKGTTTAGVFTPTSDTTFVVSGGGAAYGLGAEFFAGRHSGIGVGYTVFNVQYKQASIADDSAKRLRKSLSQTMAASDVTFLYHF